MSTVLARRVASSPVRTAAQTWAKIVEIIAPDPQSTARKELAKAAGVACASISSEATKDAAIVVWGGGPREAPSARPLARTPKTAATMAAIIS